jgi:peptidoglycan/LPS O-acetylase OafA/YrhL
VAKAVVMLDAGFEAVLATVLLMGVLYADLDGSDFPAPAGDTVIAVFALVLYALAIGLATLVKHDALSRRVLGLLAALNAAFGLLCLAWVVLGSGFSAAGSAVTWTTAIVLLVLAASQAVARAGR